VRWIQSLALVLGGPGLAVAAPDDEVVPFREAWGGAVVVPVSVAGSGVHEFLLGTGTTSTILEPELAAEVGVVPSARTSLVTPAGRRPAGVGRVDLALGSARLAGVEVVIAELPAIRSDQRGVRGILGQSALASLEYTIDHAHRRLVVHRMHPGAASGEEAAARPALDVRLGCGRVATRLIVDSGVATPVLFGAGDGVLEVESGRLVHAETNAGDGLWREARVSSVCVAGWRSGPLHVAVRPDDGSTRSEGGLLPTRYFARIRFGPRGAILGFRHW
jgi:hypothetical protein